MVVLKNFFLQLLYETFFSILLSEYSVKEKIISVSRDFCDVVLITVYFQHSSANSRYSLSPVDVLRMESKEVLHPGWKKNFPQSKKGGGQFLKFESVGNPV
jgi:hypothetical protein